MARPTKMTEEVVAKLEEALKDDLTVEQACAYAGIHKSTFYREFQDDLDFATKMQRAKQYIFHKAQKNVVKSILNGSTEDSKWYLSRKYKAESFNSIVEKIDKETDIFGF